MKTLSFVLALALAAGVAVAQEAEETVRASHGQDPSMDG